MASLTCTALPSPSAVIALGATRTSTVSHPPVLPFTFESRPPTLAENHASHPPSMMWFWEPPFALWNEHARFSHSVVMFCAAIRPSDGYLSPITVARARSPLP